MTGYVLAGGFALLCLLTLWFLLGAQQKVSMLYRECLAINARWRVAASYIALIAVRDAVMGRRAWTASDEAELLGRAEELKKLGVSVTALHLEQPDSPRSTRSSHDLVH